MSSGIYIVVNRYLVFCRLHNSLSYYPRTMTKCDSVAYKVSIGDQLSPTLPRNASLTMHERELLGVGQPRSQSSLVIFG
jgi:hypothetical protein